MAKIVDNRTKIEDNLFAEIGPGGSLMFSSGYIDGIGEDNELHTELIISKDGIESIIDLLAKRRLTQRAVDGATGCAICGSTDPSVHFTEAHRLTGTPRN